MITKELIADYDYLTKWLKTYLRDLELKGYDLNKGVAYYKDDKYFAIQIKDYYDVEVMSGSSVRRSIQSVFEILIKVHKVEVTDSGKALVLLNSNLLIPIRDASIDFFTTEDPDVEVKIKTLRPEVLVEQLRVYYNAVVMHQLGKLEKYIEVNV